MANPDPTTDIPDSIIFYTTGDDVISQTEAEYDIGWTIYDTEYFLYDGHGSTRQLGIYDATPGVEKAVVTDVYNYDAYGVMVGNTSSPLTNLLYAGEYYDNNMSNYYLRARWYDTTTGRFNRTDPWSGNRRDPQSLHKYLYCHANPINSVDPTGKFSSLTGITISIAILSITAGLISGTISHLTGGSFARGFATGTITTAIGLTLVAFGVPPHVAFGISGALAQVTIEAVSGGFQNPEHAATRIVLAGVLAGTFAWVGSVKFDFLSVEPTEIGAVLAEAGLGKSVVELTKELTKISVTGLFFGLQGRLMELLQETMEKTTRQTQGLTPAQKSAIADMIKNLE